MCYLGSKQQQLESAHNLVLQVESLHRVGDRVFDLVVLDECESILTQLTSVKTHSEHLRDNHATFICLLKQAEKIICMDFPFPR